MYWAKSHQYDYHFYIKSTTVWAYICFEITINTESGMGLDNTCPKNMCAEIGIDYTTS